MSHVARLLADRSQEEQERSALAELARACFDLSAEPDLWRPLAMLWSHLPDATDHYLGMSEEERLQCYAHHWSKPFRAMSQQCKTGPCTTATPVIRGISANPRLAELAVCNTLEQAKSKGCGGSLFVYSN